LTPRVGEDSAYLGGKAAHWEGCKYRTRDGDSVHTLQRRFQHDDETVARVQKRKAENAEKNAKRKLAKALADEDEMNEELEEGKARKSNKRAKYGRPLGDDDDGEMVEKPEQGQKPTKPMTKGKKGNQF
jgi:hypothetical protein